MPSEQAFRPMPKEMEDKLTWVDQAVFKSKKYRMGLEMVTALSYDELRQAHPEWPLKDILAETVKGFNPDLPPHLLVEMTQLICRKWEEEKATVPA